jgi:hypothetical protein
MNWLSLALPLFNPGAVAWVRAQERSILKKGRALDAREIAIARAVGVQAPERIRVQTIDELALAINPVLRYAAGYVGLLGSGTIGLTLGHGIYIRNGSYSGRLLAHECRHVHQYEAAGSIDAFIPRYLKQVVAVGYRDAPYEIDARAHEHLG